MKYAFIAGLIFLIIACITEGARFFYDPSWWNLARTTLCFAAGMWHERLWRKE